MAKSKDKIVTLAKGYISKKATRIVEEQLSALVYSIIENYQFAESCVDNVEYYEKGWRESIRREIRAEKKLHKAETKIAELQQKLKDKKNKKK